MLLKVAEALLALSEALDDGAIVHGHIVANCYHTTMIELTQDAAAFLQQSMKDKKKPDTTAVRFTVKGGGCSGFTLDVSFSPARHFEMPRKNDLTHLSQGIRILSDRKSMLFLKDMTVDLVKTQFGHKLTYNNPNATGVCGCGESFSV